MNKKILIPLLGLMLISCGSTSNSSLSSSNEISSNDQSSVEVSSSSSELSSSSEIAMKDSKAYIYTVPEGVPLYEDAEVFIGDTKADIYQVKVNLSQVWNGLAPNRTNNGYIVMELEGKMVVTVKMKDEISETYTRVRPEARATELDFGLDKRSFSFTISSAGKYTIEPNGQRSQVIHLIVNERKEIAMNLNDPSVLFFGPGLHTAESSTLIPSNSIVNLESNKTVYLAYGAVVRARFYASQKSNIRILGGGIIDGATFPRIAGQPSGNTAFVPLDFNDCSLIQFEDFTVLDPAGWTVNWYFINDSTITNINIITSRSNGDGISLQSCQDIVVKDSFVRGWDDNLVVKNYPRWDNRNMHGTTRNIRFQDCTLWTDLAQSMEIGYETVGQVMEDITFENITVLKAYHKPVISIHNGNNAQIKRVTFKNITVEAAVMGGGDSGGNNQLIQLNNLWSSNWSDQHTVTPLGSIDGVLIENVRVLDGNNQIAIDIRGTVDTRTAYEGSIHLVKNVTLKDLMFKKVTVEEGYPYLTMNTYAEQISIVRSANPIMGASVYQSWSESELQNYLDYVTVYTDFYSFQ